MSYSINPGHHGHCRHTWQFVDAVDPPGHAVDAQVRWLPVLPAAVVAALHPASSCIGRKGQNGNPLVPGQHQARDDQQRQAERGGDQGMAGGEAWRMVSLAHENGCNLDSCAGRKGWRCDFRVSGKEAFTENLFGKPFRINEL